MKNVFLTFLVIAIALFALSPEVMASFSATTDGEVYAVIVQPNGKILIGGWFTAVNGQARTGLARLNQDGSLDTSFKIRNAGIVHGLTLQADGRILVGGEFLQIDGTTVGGGIVRLLSDGSLDTSFNAGTAGFVQRIVVQPDGKILIGGQFSGINNSTLAGFARLNSDGTLDTAFQSVFSPDDGASIYAIAVRSNGRILIGGDFSKVQGTARKYIAQLNSNGTLDLSFTDNMQLEARYIVQEIIIQPDEKVLATGDYYQQLNSATSVNGLARFNTDGTLDQSFTVRISVSGGKTHSMALQPDGRILLGTLVAGGNLFRLDSDGTTDTTFADPSPDGTPNAIALQKDGKILLGSSSENFSKIARFLSNGALDSTQMYKMTTAVSGSGTGTVQSDSYNPGIACSSGISNDCDAFYDTGRVVNLTATPASGSIFAGWSGACTGTGTCVVTMSSAKSVGALFVSASITWRHQVDGKVYGMTTSGSAVTGGSQFWQEPNPTWSIVGQGDFDGDGIRDFVWWNSSTGQVYIMLMSSPTAVKSGAVIYSEPDTNWRIVTTGDINGDGRSDLIWWNKTTGLVYAMLIQGTTITGGSVIHAEPDTSWKIVAAADFDGNGTSDLLWWNQQSGKVYLMRMNGLSVAGGSIIWTEANTDWRIAGAGDLDGDGKADIIWHNRTTGGVYGMQTNGSSVNNGAMMYTEPNTQWKIVSVGTYNSDNKADLLWWNQQTGQVYLMLMNGLTAAGGSLLYTESDTTWRIQGDTEWRDAAYGSGMTTTTR